MCKIFVEYQVIPSFVTQYKQWLKENVHTFEGVEVLESTGQSGLFVEIWSSKGGIDTVKAMRQKPSSPWSELAKWIEGGEEKIKMWEFETVVSFPN